MKGFNKNKLEMCITKESNSPEYKRYSIQGKKITVTVPWSHKALNSDCEKNSFWNRMRLQSGNNSA